MGTFGALTSLTGGGGITGGAGGAASSGDSSTGALNGSYQYNGSMIVGGKDNSLSNGGASSLLPWLIAAGAALAAVYVIARR